MKSHNNLFIIFILSLFLAQCRKDKSIPPDPEPCNGCPVYHISDVKDWLYFQPGTYWIYEEENSGMIDSVYVTSNTYDDGTSGSAFFRCETYSTYNGYYYNIRSNNPTDSEGCLPTITRENFCVIVERVKTKPGNFVGTTILFPYRNYINKPAYAGGPPWSIITVEEILDSITIQNKLFYQIVKLKNTEDVTENNQETNYFISKNIGIVKRVLIDSVHVWNLIRYNIIQ